MLTPEVEQLINHVPEASGYYKRLFQQEEIGYEEGDELCPLFSERFLYDLLGKEEARTVRALLRRALTSLGSDEMELLRAGL